MLKEEADQERTRKVVSGHNGSQGKVLEATQHVPFTVTALDPDFILFLTDHGEVSFRGWIVPNPRSPKKVTEGQSARPDFRHPSVFPGNRHHRRSTCSSAFLRGSLFYFFPLRSLRT